MFEFGNINKTYLAEHFYCNMQNITGPDHLFILLHFKSIRIFIIDRSNFYDEWLIFILYLIDKFHTFDAYYLSKVYNIYNRNDQNQFLLFSMPGNPSLFLRWMFERDRNLIFPFISRINSFKLKFIGSVYSIKRSGMIKAVGSWYRENVLFGVIVKKLRNLCGKSFLEAR